MKGEAIRNLQAYAGVNDYANLHDWSISNPDDFWRKAWSDCQIVGDPGDVVLLEQAMESAHFFANGTVNAGHSLVNRGDSGATALVEVTETGERRSLARGDLVAQVAAVAAALREADVGLGDRVAVWSPNCLEANVFALGALSVGSIVSSCAPEFALQSVVDRFSQTEPKVLLVGSTYAYGGKTFDMRSLIPGLVAGLPSVRLVVVADPQDGLQLPSLPIEIQTWTSWTKVHAGSAYQPVTVPFNHPGFILFSSGTTGKPKAIIHSLGGVLLKVLSEQVYHFDLMPGDRASFYTTCGWMMWNWSLILLGTGATVLIYNGHPLSPRSTSLLEFAQSEELTFLGVSPKYLETLSQHGVSMAYDLKHLKTLASTGAPLASSLFSFVREEVSATVDLVSMSGGTDICGCFVLGVPTKPIVDGEIQGAALGMAVQVLDAEGQPSAVDETGDLVCVKPFPSQPLGFLGDSDGTRYRETYFSKFAGVWTHGDFIAKTPSGGFVIQGRSDATLNRAGIRIGTSEIYSVVNSMPEIVDSIVVGQRHELDIRVLLFIVLSDRSGFTPELEMRIRDLIRHSRSPRHLPDEIIVVNAVPRTVSGKIAELAVTDIVNGDPVRNTGGLANPDCLEEFRLWALRGN